MNTICECGTHAEEPARRCHCHDCGSACCGSCQVDVDNQTYCRWCAAAFIAV